MHEANILRCLGFGVLTVSDSRDISKDVSGRNIISLAEAEGHNLVSHILVRDDIAAIRRALKDMLDLEKIDFVVVTGGTGVSRRDVTPEAIRPLLEREIPGFGEAFRALSFKQIGARAILSRALAGVLANKCVFVLPGSTKAVEMGMRELVLPLIGHMLWEVRR